MNTDIYHCVYTHATDGRSGTGGRFERVEPDAAELLPSEAYRELQSFLEKLDPESNEPAYAMRRFSAGSKRYACFISSYRGFADAANRIGVLSHARVLQLEPEAVWFDPWPLAALGEEFPIDAVRDAEPIDRLQAYIERIANEEVIVRPLTREELRKLPREKLREVLLAALAASGDARGRRRAPAPGLPVTQLARAWAALPVGLQRRSFWAYGTREGLPVPLTWSTTAERTVADIPSDLSVRAVDDYLALLLKSTYDLGPLVRDENLELGAFAQQVQRAAGTAAAVTAGMAVEMIDMSKKSQKPGPRPRARPDAEPIDGNSIVDLNRQYDRMFEALKEYVDLRLEAHESGRATRPAARGSSGELPLAGGPWWQRYALPIGALVAGILLTLGVLAFMGWLPFGCDRTTGGIDTAAVVDDGSGQTTSAQDEQEDEQGYAAAVPAREPSANLRGLVTEAARSKQWAEAFLALTTSEPETVTALIDKAVLHPTSGADVRQKLAALKARVAAKTLQSTDRAALRVYLLQYIATQVATADAGVVIDEKVTDLGPAVMKRLKDETNAASSETEPSKIELQGEIILRWLEKHPS